MAFFSLLLSARGLGAEDISLILGMALLARVLGGPLWGLASDRIGRVRPVLAAGCVVAALAVLSVLVVDGFWRLLAVVMLFGAGVSGLMPLSDTLALTASRRFSFDFGHVRAAGSAAFMLAAVGAGFVVSATGLSGVAWLMAGGYALSLLLIPTLPEARPVTSRLAGVGSVGPLSIPAFRLLLASSALIQGSHAAFYALSSLYWRAAGLSDRVIGLLWAEMVLAEIVVLILGRGVAARLGPVNLIAIGAMGCVLRWSCTALTTDPRVLMLVQPLHAVSFALQYLAAIQIMSQFVPAPRMGSAQSLNAALGVAAPQGAVMWISGLLYAQIGARVFLVMAVMAGTALLLVPALRRLTPRP